MKHVVQARHPHWHFELLERFNFRQWIGRWWCAPVLLNISTKPLLISCLTSFSTFTESNRRNKRATIDVIYWSVFANGIAHWKSNEAHYTLKLQRFFSLTENLLCLVFWWCVFILSASVCAFGFFLFFVFWSM